MLIVHWIQPLVALLGLAAVFQQVKSAEEEKDDFYYTTIQRRSSHKKRHIMESVEKVEPSYEAFNYKNYTYLENLSGFSPGAPLKPLENRQLLENEYPVVKNQLKDKAAGVDCCPSFYDLIEPDGGKNDKGEFVELYKSGSYRQRFHEVSCHPQVLNKPCRFMDKKLHYMSKCVQLHNLQYALVKNTANHQRTDRFSFPGTNSDNNDTYTLDYISIRSGCICAVEPKFLSQKRKNRNRKKNLLRKNKHTKHNNNNNNNNNNAPVLGDDDISTN